MQKTNILTPNPLAITKHHLLAQVLLMSLFTVLTALGAQIEIPRTPVPFTLQTFFVLVSGAVLGKRLGAYSQVLYLMAGVIGLPVFSGWGFGAARLAGPAGGYLLSFPAAAFAVGYLVNRRSSLLGYLVSMTAGSFVIFSLGTIHLYLVYYRSWSEAISGGFLIFSVWDLLKLTAAALIARRLVPLAERSDIRPGRRD